MNLLSPTGTLIVATLEQLSGKARIIPGSARPDGIDGFEFHYEGSTQIDWNGQRTVVRDEDRVFLDAEGAEFQESELTLVPQTEQQAAADTIITVTMEGGVIHAVEGIPPGVTIRTIDFDIEGADPEVITTLPGGEKAYVNEWSADRARTLLARKETS